MDGRVLGAYKLERQLAVGGMAEIYVATAGGVAGFEKRLALKVIHPNFSADPEFMRMLVDEAKLAVQLQHGNIVQTYDLGRVDDTYYVVMELIDGIDLFKILKQTATQDAYIPIEMAAYIAHEVASGLDYAHRKKDPDGKPLRIVHRDISPQNVLVSFAGQVKIVDFGIAKVKRAGREHTAAGVIKGKYYYMSPEQAWGDPLDGRSDLFSTGILLHEMLAGEMLYFEEDFDRLLDLVRKADVKPPSARRAGVPASLDAIVMRALRRKPGDRYQTAGELANALAEWLREHAPEFTAPKLGQYATQLFGPTAAARPRMPEELTGQLVSAISIVDEHSLIFKLSDLPRAGRATGDDTPGPELRTGASSLLQLEPATGPSSLLQLEPATGITAPSPLPRAFSAPPDSGITSVAKRPSALLAGGGSASFGEVEQTEVDRPLPLRRELVDEEDDAAGPTVDEPSRDTGRERIAASPLAGLDESDDEHTALDGPPLGAAGVPAAGSARSTRPSLAAGPAQSLARSGLPGVRDAPGAGPRGLPGVTPKGPPSRSDPAAGTPFAASVLAPSEDTGSIDAPTGQWHLGAALPAPLPSVPTARPRARTPAGASAARAPAKVTPDRAERAAPAPRPTTPPRVASAARTPSPVGAEDPLASPGREGAAATATHTAPSPGLAAAPVTSRPAGWPFVPSSSPVLPSGLSPSTGATPLEEPLPRPRASRVGWLFFGLAVIAVIAGLITALVAPVMPTRGAIDVVSLPPGAQVRLDAHPAGATPLRIDDVDAKTPHELTLTLGGYDPAERHVEFLPGQREITLQVVLAPLVGSIKIESTPAGAEVIVNGRFRGQTPIEVSDLLPTEDAKVELRLRGYRVERRQLPWLGRPHLDLSIPLDRAR